MPDGAITNGVDMHHYITYARKLFAHSFFQRRNAFVGFTYGQRIRYFSMDFEV